MSRTSMWIHGNAVVVQSPENLSDRLNAGWGAELSIRLGTDTWLHIPVPTPIVNNDLDLALESVTLLFRCDDLASIIDTVDIYDGGSMIQEFGNLNLTGHDFTIPRSAPGIQGNIFTLQGSHRVSNGVSISFHFKAAASFVGHDTPIELLVLGAGGDFDFITPSIGTSLGRSGLHS
jgi:hypothetical protein